MKTAIVSIFLITINAWCVAQPAMEGDWSRVRMYGHNFKNEDFTTEQYNFIRDNYGMFCIEKRHAKDVYGNTSTEVSAAATAKKIVAANPDCKVLMYWSTNTAYTAFYTTVADAIGENPSWVDPSNDRYVYPDDCKDWWVKTADSLVSETPEIYGIFGDGVPGAESRGQIANVNDNLGALSALSSFNIYNGYRVASTSKTYAGATTLANSNGVYCEAFFRTPVDTPDEGVKLMDELLAIPSDKYIVCRGAGDVFSTSIDFFIASFLIVANDNSFFTWGGTENSYGADESLIYWDDNLNKYIGSPLGKAVKNGYVYTRKFKNCTVTVNLENSETSIVWGRNVPQGENIAVNGVATQSSTNVGAASRAIDGNTNGTFANGSVTQTNSESDAWWQVDLGSNYPIGEISLHTRTDACCKDDLADVTVYVLDNNNNTTYSKYYRNVPDATFTFDASGAIGKTIKVQSHKAAALSIAEVEVFQYQHAIDFIVTDKISNQGLSEVSFSIASSTFITDSNGETKAYIPAGLYDVTFSKPGYLSKTISVDLPTDNLVSVELEKGSYELTFLIKDAVDSSVLSGATVSLNNADYTTNASGSTVVSLDMGSYSYTVSKSGYTEKIGTVEISKDTTISVLLSVLITNTETYNNISIEIYPNPVEDILHINFTDSLESSYVIISSLGQTVKCGMLKQKNNVININDLKSGIYIVKVYNNGMQLLQTKIVNH